MFLALRLLFAFGRSRVELRDWRLFGQTLVGVSLLA